MRRKYRKLFNAYRNDFLTSRTKEREEKNLADLLYEHDAEGVVPFHMPGHKRADFDFLLGAQRIDITEIEGFDNLHDASGVILDCEKRASSLYGTKASRFLVNGSTAGVLGAINATTTYGDKVLVARNCHRSVFNAIELFGLCPIYLEPTYFEEYGFYGSVSALSVREAFEKNKNIKLCIITSPTYEGVISDIASVAEICHANGATLFVDEAHGAHLGLCKKFEKSARSLGADIVVNSLHKTLPSLTQTAILHVCSDRVDIEKVNASLAKFETSSPSYVLMASMDGCIRFLEKFGAEALCEWSKNIDVARKSLSRLKKIDLFDGRKDGRVFAYDKTKFVFTTNRAGMSGVEFKKKLRQNSNIELEMASVSYAIAMSGLGDDRRSFLALEEGVFDIEDGINSAVATTKAILPILPQKAFNPCEIARLSVEYVDFEQSVGKVCAENVWAYPPGAPIIAKGEIIDLDVIKYATIAYESGVSVASETRRFPTSVLCVLDK